MYIKNICRETFFFKQYIKKQCRVSYKFFQVNVNQSPWTFVYENYMFKHTSYASNEILIFAL